MLNKIVFDLETQKEFSEVGGRKKYHLLRVSVVGAYSYAEDKYYVFEEPEVHKFGELLQGADQIIGYNIRNFDYAVLAPYLNFSPSQIPTLDILQVVEESLGHRIRLEAIAQATLGEGKSGTGISAINLWKRGEIDVLKKYCLQDVRLTKEIYEYGMAKRKLMFQDFFDVREFPVEFPEPEKRQNVVRQSSLF